MRERLRSSRTYNAKVERVLSINVNLIRLTTGHAGHNCVVTFTASKHPNTECLNNAGVVFISTRVKVGFVGYDTELGGISDVALEPTTLVILERFRNLRSTLLLGLDENKSVRNVVAWKGECRHLYGFGSKRCCC
jgi:hypothetical protein